MAKYRIAWLPGDRMGIEWIAAGPEDFKIGLSPMRLAAAGARGFQQLIQGGQYLC
jgi:hypothetical protein